MLLWHCQTVGLSWLVPRILPVGLWLFCSLAASQEICSSPGTLPAPRLFLDRLSARQGDTAMLSCLVPLDIPMTRIVFCKDGKEISVQPKEGNKLVYDSPYQVSRESSGAFSCRYQLKDDNNQENNSHSSDSWHLHVAGDESNPTPRSAPGGEHSHSHEPDGSSCSGNGGSTGQAWPQGILALGLIVGLAVTAGLALALLGCFLMKTAVSRRRTHRDPIPDRSSLAAEDQIQCAEVTRAGPDQGRWLQVRKSAALPVTSLPQH
ncbi:uncharacterized protein LOC123350052 isoform X2 [Mauremys mutica]|uniref:uncharacterized protein LOC123350052 isoform X2 n=1 Tax=Mauremys mutica TaxID=74926 RepID=UPI001D162F78|nr:uncharacterized protein LOC123350052 isoform X2 [Mauremys mutica]